MNVNDGFSAATLRYVDLLYSLRNFLAQDTTDQLTTELIDKCVGSQIWVIMKGEKGSKSAPLVVNFRAQ